MINKRDAWKRSKADVALIIEVLLESSLLSRLPYASIFEIAKGVTLEKRDPTANDRLWRAGQSTDRMYFIISGSVKLIDREGRERGSFIQGDTFGARALAAGKGGHTDDCVVQEASSFAAIHKSLFVEHVKVDMERFVRPQTKFLTSCAALNGCTTDDYFALALAQEIVRLGPGEDLSMVTRDNRSGELKHNITIIMEGACVATRKCKLFNVRQNFEMSMLGPGEAIGPDLFVKMDMGPLAVKTLQDTTLVILSLRDIRNTRSSATVQQSMDSYFETKRQLWDDRTREKLHVLERSRIEVASEQDKAITTAGPLVPNTDPELEEDFGAPLDKFAVTSHLQLLQQNRDVDGESGWLDRSPSPRFEWEAPVVIQPTKTLIMAPSGSVSHAAEMFAGILGNSEAFKPAGLKAKLAARDANPEAEALASSQKEELERVEMARLERTTLPPLCPHTIQTPRKFLAQQGLNNIARRRYSDLNRRGLTDKDIQMYAERTRSQSADILRGTGHLDPPIRISLLPSRQGPRPPNPKYSKVASTVGGMTSIFRSGKVPRGAAHRGADWRFQGRLVDEDKAEWRRQRDEKTERMLRKESLEDITHATKNFGSRFPDPYGGLRDGGALKMPIKRVLNCKPRREGPICDHEDDGPKDIYDGCDGFRVCLRCGNRKRFVKAVKEVKTTVVKSFQEEENAYCEAANRAKRDPKLLTHSKSAIGVFDQINAGSRRSSLPALPASLTM